MQIESNSSDRSRCIIMADTPRGKSSKGMKSRSVFSAGDSLGNCRKTFAIRLRVLRCAQVERQLVDLARELVRALAAIFEQSHRRAGVEPHVECPILRTHNGRRGFHGLLVHFLDIDIKHTGAALAETRPVELEVERNRMLAGLQLRPSPNCAL